jgi:glyoxylase-like metal-dependent hydrolase (beta-lactamase superfamily II)
MLSAAPAVSRAEDGTPDPVRAVSVISTGTVEIHPEHAFGTSKPLYWWLLTSRRWLPSRPINVYVIEHAKGRLPARPHPAPGTAVAPDQLRANRRSGPGAVHPVAGCHGRRFAGPAPHPRAHAGSLSLLIRRQTRSPLLLVGDLTYEAELLERRQLPGVGGRSRLATTTNRVLALKERMPDLAILPAHDPTAAQRLLES